MKPISISLKDWLVQTTAKDLEIDENLVNTIISWSYLKVKEKTQTVKSIELSGFGKLLLSETKTKKKIKKKYDFIKSLEARIVNSEDEEKKEQMRTGIATVHKEIEYLKTKLENENCLERHP